MLELAPSKVWKQSDLCKLCIGVGVCICQGIISVILRLYINIGLTPDNKEQVNI